MKRAILVCLSLAACINDPDPVAGTGEGEGDDDGPIDCESPFGDGDAGISLELECEGSSSDENGGGSSSSEGESDGGSGSTGEPEWSVECPGPFCPCETRSDCLRPCLNDGDCAACNDEGCSSTYTCGGDSACTESAFLDCGATSGMCELHDYNVSACRMFAADATQVVITDSSSPYAMAGMLYTCVIECTQASDCDARGMPGAACAVVPDLDATPSPICTYG